MLNFLTSFLSLSGGAIFGQAVYFLFVKYPAELSRLNSHIVESKLKFGWEMKEEDLALDLLNEFAEHHRSLFREWSNLTDADVRQKHMTVLAKDLWRAKTIDGAGNVALSRAAQISSDALTGMRDLLAEPRPLTDTDLSIAEAQSGSTLDSFGAALRMGHLLNNSRRAKYTQFENETNNLKFIRVCARFCVLIYGVAAAEIAEFELLHMPVPHLVWALTALYGIFGLTLLLLAGSYVRERRIRAARSELEKKIAASEPEKKLDA